MTVTPITDIAETFARLAGYPNAKAHQEAMKRAREFNAEIIARAARMRVEDQQRREAQHRREREMFP